MKLYPTLELVFQALDDTKISGMILSAQAGLSKSTYYRARSTHNCSFSTYEKLVALCRTYYPNQDWSYVTLDCLEPRTLARLASQADIPRWTLNNIVYEDVCPSFFTYAEIVDKLSAIGFEFQKDGEQSHGTDI